ncbi:MAG: hypothetical protein R2760_07245 [Chitinophagales bacterium]
MSYPIINDITNTQHFNRYSYVWNNPLKYTDPSGYDGTNIFGWGYLVNNINNSGVFFDGGSFSTWDPVLLGDDFFGIGTTRGTGIRGSWFSNFSMPDMNFTGFGGGSTGFDFQSFSGISFSSNTTSNLSSIYGGGQSSYDPLAGATAQLGGGIIQTLSNYNVFDIARKWSDVRKHIFPIANKLGLAPDEWNGFRHYFGNIYLFNMGYNPNVIQFVQNLHEINPTSKYDSQADKLNNKISNSIYSVLQQNKVLGSMSYKDIAINALSLMYGSGFYVGNESLKAPIFNKMSFNRFVELLNLLKKII